MAWLLRENRSMFLMSGPLSLSIVDASFLSFGVSLSSSLGGLGAGKRYTAS